MSCNVAVASAERQPAAVEEQVAHPAADVGRVDLDLDPGFLMSRAVLEEIARQQPATEKHLLEIPDVRNWQVEAIGPQLLHELRA